MFLITTADQRFWRTDEPVLFLGEWCKLFSQRAVWEKLTYEVLPYHWDDRKKLYHDYLYLDKLYEDTLGRMTPLLNQIHGVDHSVRYWRIIIGPWLYCFIQILFDRYESILTAIEYGKVKNTLICRGDETKWLPNDFPCFLKWYVNDGYNHYLYSRVIEHTDKIPFDIFDMEDGNKHSNQTNRFNPKLIIKKLIGLNGKLVPDRYNQIVLVSSYLPPRDTIKLQLSLKQIPYIFPPYVDTPKVGIDPEKRQQLNLRLSKNEFELFLTKIMMKQMPLIYLEGYEQMNALSLKAYPQNPRAIFTANAFFSNETFKFWAAHHVDRGVKFMGTQHGGLYGAALWYGDETHELKIYDNYYTWGWKSDIYEHVKPIPSIALSKIKENQNAIYPIKNGRILVVLANYPRYYYHMYSIPFSASGTLRYFKYQYDFCKSLSDEIQKLLLIRLYRHDYDWNQSERWVRELPGIECYKGEKSLLKQLKECRLCLVTYNATTVLETFSVNFPTVLLWNPKDSELRPSAQPYYNKLNQAGILHYTPESAAAKVNEIYQDPISWWRHPEIQNAKDEFCNQFAKTSENYINEWVKEFKNISYVSK